MAWLVAAAAFAVIAPGAWGQQACPADDQNQNYNCPVGPDYIMPGWGNLPWSQPQYFETIQTGDVDGDGAADLVGRDSHGLHLYMFNAAVGTWQPVLTTDGSAELVLTDFSDANGWNAEKYYQTIKLVKLDASPTKLVARGGAGLYVYQFTKGATTKFGFPTGSWQQIASSGPFSDADNWGTSPYYQTLRYGFIDGGPNASVIGWGTQGLATLTWNGSGWTNRAGTPDFGDAANAPGDVVSMQIVKVDTSGKERLIMDDDGGLSAFQFVSGAGWKLLAGGETFGDIDCDQTTLTCSYTLQTATLDSSGVPTIISRLSFCSGGMAGVKLDLATSQFVPVFFSGPFNDCTDGFAPPQNFRSIRAADIDGDGIDELIGRGPHGILVYRWNNASKTWSPMVTNVPALSDTLWATDPSYWQTFLTAKIAGNKSALLARGQNGVRTWLYNGSTLARPQPYGNFPALDGASYTAINNFLSLPQPDGVRNLYKNPSVDTTASQLNSYSSQLINARNGCQNEVSADPPQYQTCDALVGTQNPAYTATVNQLIKEMWYAGNAIDHFTTLQTMQGQLFTTQSSELPSLDANLQIPQAGDQSSEMDYFNLFATILNLAGAITGDPAVSIAADALSLLVSAQPLFQQPQTAKALEQKYSDIVSTVADLQQSGQTLNLARKHHVLGDYGMLATAGQLVGSQVWTLDQAGYLSVARFGFTYWVMQALLPAVWDQFQVTGCQNQNPPNEVTCSPPPSGPNMQSYGGGNFTGFLPKQTPCQQSCYGKFGCITTCTWTTFSSAAASLVFSPVTAQCTYAPGTGNAWVYPAPNVPGCSLGAAAAMFGNSGGWQFQTDQIPVGSIIGVAISGVSVASGLHDPAQVPQLRLQLLAPLSAPIDLGSAQLRVVRLLREIGGAEELVKDALGNDFVPSALLPQQVSAGRATFVSPPGQTPRVSAVVQSKPGVAVNIDMTVDRASILDPQLCVGTPPTRTRLHVQVQLSGGGLPQPVTFGQIEDWQCVTDAQGTLRMLTPAGTPAWRVSFLPLPPTATSASSSP